MRHILSLLALTLTSCGAEEPALVPVPTTTASGMTAEPEDLQTLLDEQTRLSEGLSDTLLFEVPEGTWSLTIVIEGPGTYTLASWTDSEGTELVRDRWIDTEGDWVCRSCLNPVGWADEAFATVAPNNPDAEIVPGEHAITLAGDWDERVAVTVTAKVMPTPPDTGVLDLNLWFTGAYGLTAEAAQDDAYFQEVLAYVDTLYARVGLELGTLEYHELGAEWQVVESTWGPGNDLSELLSQSSEARQNALNVFFVDELYVGAAGSPPGDLIIGISAGTPGAPLVQGTGSSGVVVTTWSTLDIPASQRWVPALAGTIAHETGHFLGLEHTTEYDGTPDNLPDTADDDRGNLMHWDPDPEQGELSPYQGRMMLQNPWVRHP